MKIILPHSFMDRFWWKFVWILISKRHNLSLNYIWHEMSLLCYRKILRIFFTWPSELITTLTYILMDNCFPFFCIIEYIFFLANELAKMIKTKDVYKTMIKKSGFLYVCVLISRKKIYRRHRDSRAGYWFEVCKFYIGNKFTFIKLFIEHFFLNNMFYIFLIKSFYFRNYIF